MPLTHKNLYNFLLVQYSEVDVLYIVTAKAVCSDFYSVIWDTAFSLPSAAAPPWPFWILN